MSESRRNKAVALRYNTEQDVAPVVIAAGYGEIAEKIIDIAEKKGIPVFRDDSAASLMCMLEVGSNIPPELYEVVAAIYCQLLQMSAEIKNVAAPAAPKAAASLLARRRAAVRRAQAAPPAPEEAPAPEPPSAGGGAPQDAGQQAQAEPETADRSL